MHNFWQVNERYKMGRLFSRCALSRFIYLSKDKAQLQKRRGGEKGGRFSVKDKSAKQRGPHSISVFKSASCGPS